MEETLHPAEVTEQSNLAPEGSGEAGRYFIEYNLTDEKVSGSLFRRSTSTESTTQNMSLSASEVGSHVFDEGQTVDAERRGSFALAAGAEDATRYLR